jgi:hypothetical protein
MPVKRCVRFNRNLYCFNKGNDDVTVYREQTYKLNECPQEVISAFIKNEYDMNIVIDEKIPPLTDEEITVLMKRLQEKQLENQ